MRNDEGYGGTVDLLPCNTLSGGECLVTHVIRSRAYCSKKCNGLQSCRKGTVGL